MVRRVVDTAFWTDMEVIDSYSIEDKYFYLYLITNDKSTQVGIYPLPKKIMSFETGFTTEVVQVLLDRFSQTYGKIQYSEKTQEITILESLQYSILKGGKPVSDLLTRELRRVKDEQLILATYDRMKEFWTLSQRPFDQTIQALFEKELNDRGLLARPEKAEEKPRDSQPEGSGEASGTADEEALLERYRQFIRQTSAETEGDIALDDLLERFYAEKIGPLTPEVVVYLTDWAKLYPQSLILEALNRSQAAQKPLHYAATILTKWQAEGAQTLRDVLKMDRAFNRKTH